MMGGGLCFDTDILCYPVTNMNWIIGYVVKESGGIL